jgi:hypothetical protein
LKKLNATGIFVLSHGLLSTGSNKACPRENGDAYLTKILEIKPTTFNEFKLAINSLLEFASTSTLSKNERLARDYFKIKSKRMKKKLAA